MKTTKRLFAVALSVLIVLLCAIPAFAVAGTDGTLTVENAKSGETYKVYRVLDLNYEATDNFSYTPNTSFVNFFRDALELEDGDTLLQSAVYSYVRGENKAELAVALANYVKDNSIAAAKSVTATSDDVTIEDLPYGYYLMVPETVDGSAIFSLDTAIPNATIVNKSVYPTPDKTVSNNGTQYGKTNIAGVGDTVYFKVEGTVPDMTGYDTYTFTIKDTLSKMTYKADTYALTIDGVDVPADKHSFSYDAATKTFTVTVADLTAYTKDDAIVFTYQATVDSDAVVGGAGNDNTAHFEFSNDPTDNSSKDSSEDDKTTTFVVGIEVIKTDATGNEISGAEWKLTKDGTEITGGVTTDAHIKWTGLSAGNYKLEETKAPNGKVIIETPIEFSVSATGQISAAGVSSLATLAATGQHGNVTNYAADLSTGIVTLTVKNLTESELPNTGGVGLYVIIGAAAVAMAGFVVFMIIRKKAAK